MSPFPMEPGDFKKAKDRLWSWDPGKKDWNGREVIPRCEQFGDKSFWAKLAGIWRGWVFLWFKRREWSIRALWRLIVTWRFGDSLDYIVRKDLYDQDLDDFESAMTAECIKQGLPMVFIQPGAPGHKQAKSAAVRAFIKKHNFDAPYHPDHKRDF